MHANIKVVGLTPSVLGVWLHLNPWALLLMAHQLLPMVVLLLLLLLHPKVVSLSLLLELVTLVRLLLVQMPLVVILTLSLRRNPILVTTSPSKSLSLRKTKPIFSSSISMCWG
jgi:hypothetical protein